MKQSDFLRSDGPWAFVVGFAGFLEQVCLLIYERERDTHTHRQRDRESFIMARENDMVLHLALYSYYGTNVVLV